jgi:hypothetical protein
LQSLWFQTRYLLWRKQGKTEGKVDTILCPLPRKDYLLGKEALLRMYKMYNIEKKEIHGNTFRWNSKVQTEAQTHKAVYTIVQAWPNIEREAM